MSVEAAIRQWADENLDAIQSGSLSWTLSLVDSTARKAEFVLGDGLAVLSMSWEDTFSNAGDDTCLAFNIKEVKDSAAQNWVESLQEYAFEGASVESALSKGYRTWQKVAAKFTLEPPVDDNARSDDESRDQNSDEEASDDSTSEGALSTEGGPGAKSEKVALDSTLSIPVREGVSSSPQHVNKNSLCAISGPVTSCPKESEQKARHLALRDDSPSSAKRRRTHTFGIDVDCLDTTDLKVVREKEGSEFAPSAAGGGSELASEGTGKRNGKGQSGNEGENWRESPLATVHLARYFRDVQKICHKDCVELSLVNEDSLYEWDVHLRGFPKDCALYSDLQKLEYAAVVLRFAFCGGFPQHPPFVRVLRPRFKPMRGHVSNGGALCLDILTHGDGKSALGWSPVYSAEGLIVQIRSALIQGNGRVDFSLPPKKRDQEYQESYAIKSYQALAQKHQWVPNPSIKKRTRS